MLVDFEIRRKKNLIKSLRRKTPRQRSSDSLQQTKGQDDQSTEERERYKTQETQLTEVIIAQLQILRKKRKHFLLLIDEIDAFARGDRNA